MKFLKFYVTSIYARNYAQHISERIIKIGYRLGEITSNIKKTYRRLEVQFFFYHSDTTIFGTLKVGARYKSILENKHLKEGLKGM